MELDGGNGGDRGMTLTTTLIIIACAFSAGFFVGAAWKGLFP